MTQIFWELLPFIGIGFLAQLANGGVGAGFGVITNSILISLGIPPAVSSATIHSAEIFTSGNLAFWHWREKNIDWRIFRNLLVSGVLGGVLGALALSQIEGKILQPFIAFYLLVLGLLIFRKGILRKQSLEFQGYRFLVFGSIKLFFKKIIYYFFNQKPVTNPRFLRLLGLVSAFLDAVGGGGWGAMTTSTLVVKGENPRMVIGSISGAEFFVTLTISLTLFSTIAFLGHWEIVLGLVLGGIFAAPISAKLCRYLPPHILMILIGALMAFLSLLILTITFKA